MKTIVVLDPIAEKTAARLRALLPEGFALTHGTARDVAHQRAIIAEADAAIAGQIAVPGEVLRAATRLKILQKWGVGVDNLDLAAARELGIVVARTTGSNAKAVAEFTLGLTLSVLRQIAFAHMELKNGVWRGGRMPRDSFLLSGKTVGIVGFGAIGQTYAGLLAGFGCEVMYVKRTPLPAADETRLGARRATLDEVLERADVVSLHCPLTPETAGIIDLAALKRMKRTAVLINVARGGIVVEDDLAAALGEGLIHGAASDVFDVEPVPADNPLLGIDNMIVTPHLAAGAADTFEKTVRHMYRNIVAACAGEAVPEIDRVA